MAFRVCLGNALDRAEVTMAPASDDNYPEAYLHDGPGWLGGRFGALDADPTVTIFMGVPIDFGNGSGEGVVPGGVISTNNPDLAIEAPSEWTSINTDLLGAMITIDDSGLVLPPADHDGNGWSLAYSCGPAGGRAIQELTVVPGRTYKVKGWVVNPFGTAATAAGSIRIYDPLRGLYLKTDGTWNASPQNLVVDATTNYVWLGIGSGAGVTFTLPTSAEMGGAAEMVLQYQCCTADGGLVLFDGLLLEEVFQADLMMIAGGHNFPPAAVLKWDTSEDGSSWTNRHTFTVSAHQFFGLLAGPVTAPYHRFQMIGTPFVKHYMGDLILGVATVLPHSPAALEQAFAEAQVRNETPGRTRHISNRGPYAPRSLSFTLHMGDDDHFEAIRDLLYVAARGGAVPAVLLPSAGPGANVREPDLAIYGDLTATVSFSRPENSVPYRQCQLSIEEGAGFTIG